MGEILEGCNSWVVVSIITPTSSEKAIEEIQKQIKIRNRAPRLIVHDGSEGAYGAAKSLAQSLSTVELEEVESNSWIGDIVREVILTASDLIVCQSEIKLKNLVQKYLKIPEENLGNAFIAHFNQKGGNLHSLFEFPGNKRIFCTYNNPEIKVA